MFTPAHFNTAELFTCSELPCFFFLHALEVFPFSVSYFSEKHDLRLFTSFSVLNNHITVAGILKLTKSPKVPWDT